MPKKKNKRKHKKSQKELKIKFTGKPTIAFGGFVLFAKFFEKINLREKIEDLIPIKEMSNNSKGLYGKVLPYFLSILAGATRFNHIAYLGNVDVIKEIFGIDKISVSSAPLTKLFNKLNSWQKSDIISNNFWDYTVKLLDVKKDWLNFDSTVLERYGNQEGSEIGYNPKKRGRPSHNPLIAFLNESQYVVNLINRSGNSASANNIVNFYNQTKLRLENNIEIAGVMADSGFYNKKFVYAIEKNKHNYIIAVNFYNCIQNKLAALTNWQEIAPGIEINEFRFVHDSWDNKKRRYIAIRQKLEKRPEAHGKQLTMFPEMEIYRYSSLITNIEDLSPEAVWAQYRKRAGDENIIAALKEDFGLTGFCMKNFYATEVAMTLRVLLYNLFLIFKKNFLNTVEVKQRLKTLKLKYLYIGATLGSASKYTIVRLAVTNQKIRSKIQRVLTLIDQYVPPDIFNRNSLGGVIVK